MVISESMTETGPGRPIPKRSTQAAGSSQTSSLAETSRRLKSTRCSSGVDRGPNQRLLEPFLTGTLSDFRTGYLDALEPSVNPRPAYYAVNCVHPSALGDALRSDERLRAPVPG